MSKNKKLSLVERAEALRQLCNVNGTLDYNINLMARSGMLYHDLNCVINAVMKEHDIDYLKYSENNFALEKSIRNAIDKVECHKDMYGKSTVKSCIMLSKYFALLACAINIIEKNTEHPVDKP